MPISPSDNNLSNQDKAPTRTSPRAPWVLILPLALAAGVLLQQSQNSDNATNVAYNSVSPNIQSATPADNKLRGNNKLPGKPATYVLFVPDDNGDLRRETVVDNNWRVTKEDIAKDDMKVRSQAATNAVKMLMQRHPDDFPKGAQLTEDILVDSPNSVGDSDGTRINFNRAFIDPSFWQGSTRTLASVYAIVNTALESQKSVVGTKKVGTVYFQVEGQPIQTLGELDTSASFAADMKMVAKTVNAR